MIAHQEPIKLLIVEDELIIAEDLRDILEGLHYEVVDIAITAREALQMIEEHLPDLIILDIHIKGGKDGIDLAADIREQYQLPFLFLTSHADPATLQRAKEVEPYGYLVKPFQEKDIYAAVEMALNNVRKEKKIEKQTDEEAGFIANDSLFVRANGMLVKLKLSDITHLEADGNYTTVYANKSRYVIRAILKELEQKLDTNIFARIHKSYLVNLSAIEAIDSQAVHVGDNKIPISRTQHTWLLNHIKTL